LTKGICSVCATDAFDQENGRILDLAPRSTRHSSPREGAARIDRLSLGNPGDVAPVGDGISEMRIHYGPGYRIYYVQRGDEIVVLLCGGDKSSQISDIRAAKKLVSELEN
jgi:putative addiction module killer protein